MANNKIVPAVKVALTVFLIYHLSAVLLLPNSTSLVGRKLSRYFLNYANQLGFNTGWAFFSPAPSPMFYLEYDAEMANGEEANGGQPLVYPPHRVGFGYDDGWNRRLFGMRFFALNPERLERFFVPYLCRQVPGAQRITVQPVFERIEDVERAGEWAEFKDMSERLDLPRQKYSCPELGAG
jgi:hypothetical protein